MEAPENEGTRDNQTPILFFTALPGEGHTYPLITIATSMIQRGYSVVFHGGTQFKTEIRAIGAEFSPIPSMLDPVPDPESVVAAGKSITDFGVTLFVHGLVNFLYNTMAVRTQLLEEAIVKLRDENPTRQIIIVHELCSMNVTPFAYGRPLPKNFTSFPKTIGIGAVSISASSTDTAPFSMGLPYDTSRACLMRNEKLHQLANEGPWLPLFKAADNALRSAGCTTIPKVHPFDTWYSSPDASFQMCSPSMEYPLPDMPPKLRFAGCLPPRVTSGGFDAPSWWNDVLKRVANDEQMTVFVSQGTAHVDYQQLIIPTIEAFRGREDVLIVATLGIKGATLGKDVSVPENVRWIDFLAYDHILPYADVFVCNAGYGSTSHAVTNGIPAVLAGEALDKKEVTLRAVYAGYAWDLESATPSIEQIKTGVEAVLGDKGFKDRAMELKAENERMDCMRTIEKQIIEFTY
ncbi:hypothetical protein G7046_g3952 [Stylonectria norvegica]|nr:hypothetical protein G7046_g3952 [Stylonectria norvegica]